MNFENSTFDEIMNSLFEDRDDVTLKEKFSEREIESISKNVEFFNFPSYFINDVMGIVNSSVS